MSRCGSTLLAKALARAEQHIVINEGTPLHENLWQTLTHDWQKPKLDHKQSTRLTSLILMMARRRAPEQTQFFIKFRSWNTVLIQQIMQAFPNTPCLFVYRHPSEVMRSTKRNPPTAYLRLKHTPAATFLTGFSSNEIQNMDDDSYFLHLFMQEFRAVLAQSANLCLLNYADLNKDCFAQLLQSAFAYRPKPETMAKMLPQFDRYSKDDSNNTAFSEDINTLGLSLSHEAQQCMQQLMPLYTQLENAHQRIIF
jgi:hypothetical protein